MSAQTSRSRSSYHHGDLRTACLTAAVELLEEGADLSLRAVARRAGVSPAAPYRHYADKDELLSALAVLGYGELGRRLRDAYAQSATTADLAPLGVAYVRFALDRPALFRVMFTMACDSTATERAAAAAQVQDFVRQAVARAFPLADAEILSTAAWSLVHGLAFLHLDGKFDQSDEHAVDERVRAALEAAFGPNRAS